MAVIPAPDLGAILAGRSLDQPPTSQLAAMQALQRLLALAATMQGGAPGPAQPFHPADVYPGSAMQRDPSAAPPVGQEQLAQGGMAAAHVPANAPAWGLRRRLGLPFVNGLTVPSGIARTPIAAGSPVISHAVAHPARRVGPPRGY